MASALVSVVAFVFDLIAFVLAIAAELRRSTAILTTDTERNYLYCVYDTDIATRFGIGALLFLTASHVLIMVPTRFFYLNKALNPKVSRAWALVLFVSCWITFSVAEACLLGGSLINAQHTKYRWIFSGDQTPSCKTLRKGVFAAGAAFIFLTTMYTQLYYRYYCKALSYDQMATESFMEDTQEALITNAEAAERT